MHYFTFDIVSSLPEELSIQILCFLSVKSLMQCQLVCKRWRNFANDPIIWKRKCLELAYHDINPIKSPSNPVLWYSLYRKFFKRENNWGSGRVQTVDYLKGHSSRIFFVAIKDGMAVSLAWDRSMRFWDVEQGLCLSVISLNHMAEEVDFLPKKWVVAVSFRMEFIHVYNLREGNSKVVLVSHKRVPLHCVNIGEEILVSGSDDGIINVWDWRSTKLLTYFETRGGVLYVKVVNSSTIVSLHNDGIIQVFSVTQNKVIQQYSFLPMVFDDILHSAAINREWILCATQDLIYLLKWQFVPDTFEIDVTKPPTFNWKMDAPAVVPWCGCLAGKGRSVLSNCSSTGPICVVKPGGSVKFLTEPGQGVDSLKGFRLLTLTEQPTFMDVDDRFLLIGTKQGKLIRCGFDDTQLPLVG
ncbi:14964_t:CDS:2 [Cetraspora pellucida]|uniref:14964_t:CDS:1 n=1 Tax=Cetraspora pellucida TaxID=1433469 RepID=A0A9N9AB51_9GLOM|nr:14964_t:CDS:2 [Cetraspora pellucida]